MRSSVMDADGGEHPVCYIYPPKASRHERIGLLGNDDATYEAAQWLADQLNAPDPVKSND